MVIPEGKNPTLLIAPYGLCIYDVEVCSTLKDLVRVMGAINASRYELVTVTQDGAGTYTVFFRRPARG